MSKPTLALFLKAHVNAFTRADGTVVQAHETSSRAAEHQVHHSELKEGDPLYDRHGQKVDEVQAVTKGALRASDRIVHTRAGYEHATRGGFLKGLSNKKPS